MDDYQIMCLIFFVSIGWIDHKISKVQEDIEVALEQINEIIASLGLDI